MSCLSFSGETASKRAVGRPSSFRRLETERLLLAEPGENFAEHSSADNGRSPRALPSRNVFRRESRRNRSNE